MKKILEPFGITSEKIFSSARDCKSAVFLSRNILDFPLVLVPDDVNTFNSLSVITVFKLFFLNKLAGTKDKSNKLSHLSKG